MSDPFILDYSEFVEMICTEEDGTYRSDPTAADAIRSAGRFIDKTEIPADPFNVPYAHVEKVSARMFEYWRSRHTLFGQWQYQDSCPFCKTPLTKFDEDTDFVPSCFTKIFVQHCRNCGWWESDEHLPVENDNISNHYTAESVHRRAVLRQFAVAGSEVPVDTLRVYLQRHPEALNLVNPTKLEKLVGSVFADFLDCEAIHIGGPHDGGIDLILIDGKRRYVVQVKRRKSRNRAEPVKSIREFVGAMVLEGQVRGIFVTTAGRFSRNAISSAAVAKQKRVLEYIELVSAERLLEVLNLSGSGCLQPWRKAASKPEDLLLYLNNYLGKFRELAMGHPEWKGE